MADFEAFARSVVEEQLVSKIQTIERFKSGKNNQTYHVIFNRPIELDTPIKKRCPSTTPVRKGATQLVIRISDPAAELTEANRVQNEVASIRLITEALSDRPRRLLPEVYGWEASDEASGRRGWIMEEYLDGTVLEEVWFTETDPEKQRKLVEQLAQIYQRIQAFELPETIQDYGGLTFNDNGAIVSAPTTIPCGGPFASLGDMYQQLYRKQLELADGVEELEGWRDIENLHERLEHFMTTKLVQIADRMPKKKTLIHGDLTMANILVDPETFEVTGIVDFDFSHVASPVDECFWSFPEVGGLVLPRLEVDSRPLLELLRVRQYGGFPDDPLDGIAELKDRTIFKWPVAKLWHDTMNGSPGAITPMSLEKETPGAMEDYAFTYWLAQAICPPEILLKRWRDAVGPEGVMKLVEKTKTKLQKALDSIE